MAASSDSVQRLRRVARSIGLTPRGRGFLGAAAFGFVAARLFTVPALDYVVSLLVGLVVCAAAFVLIGHSRIHIDRSFSPDVIESGQSSTASVVVTNLSALPSLEAAWEDRLPPGVVGTAHGVMGALGGGHGFFARTTFSYDVRGVRRGRHVVGPLNVTVADPFGLVYRQHTFAQPHHVIVLPKRVDLAAISFGGTPSTGATRPAPQHVGIGDDDVIARNYLPGDAMRRMHWKATARRGALMVRQEEQRNNPEATVLLDLDAAGHATMHDDHGRWAYSPTFEWAIVAAASVATHLVQRRYAVHVLTPGGPVDRSIGDGLDRSVDLMADLAVVDPVEVSPESIAAIGSSERPVVAILGSLDEEHARAWSRLNASTGMAFVASTTSLGALAVLADAGWKCCSYHPGDGVGPLWLSLDARQFHAAR